jgi:acetyltransferase-like isoleucine patch superfamily enzyme
MRFSNIHLGENVIIDPSTNFNNVKIGNNVKISKYCSVFGSDEYPAVIGANTRINMMCFLNGFDSPLIIGERCGISQYVQIMTGSGPSASPRLQKVFPVTKQPVQIGNDCWLGAGAVIMPGVFLGDFCVVAANSFVNHSFNSFSIIGGNPAKLIRTFSDDEKALLLQDD